MVFRGTVRMWNDVVENAHFLKCILHRAVTHMAEENCWWLLSRTRGGDLCAIDPLCPWFSCGGVTGAEVATGFDLLPFPSLFQNCNMQVYQDQRCPSIRISSAR